ncbi:hypothetical protein RvY_18009 [Ramazzottius varieornatus]|uniref:Uncharacterized protein n=1 Tax=Ramazzottius varieornatus TaxID=947166 RepID=A0A1D1W9Q1_RAMVA|nr:hypothetical protein RvY_18009 [Ramazzottius varieornatus]
MMAADGTAEINEAAEPVRSATWLMGNLYVKGLASKKLMLKSMSKFLQVDEGRDRDEDLLAVDFECLPYLLMACTLRRSADLPKHTKVPRHAENAAAVRSTVR